MNKLPSDPRLPISNDVAQLKTRLHELFRQIALSFQSVEDEIAALGSGGGGGGGATLNTGTVTIDFGSGSNLASIAVTGQTSITATSSVWLELVADASGSHTANDAAYAAIFVHLTASTPSAGTGFTIYATCADKMTGTYKIRWTWS